MLISCDRAFRDRGPTVVILGAVLGVQAALGALLRSLEGGAELLSEGVDRALADPTGFRILNGLPDVHLVRDDDGQSGQHGLGDSDAKVFIVGGQDEQVGGLQQGGFEIAGNEAGEGGVRS